MNKLVKTRFMTYNTTMPEKIISVYCRKGHIVFEKYHKIGKGRLQKCYIDQIGQDHTNGSEKAINDFVYCLKCNPMLPVAIVSLIHGRKAYKIIQSGIRKVVT